LSPLKFKIKSSSHFSRFLSPTSLILETRSATGYLGPLPPTQGRLPNLEIDMSSPTNAELSALASSGQEGFVPAAEEARQNAPHSFLTLAPTTSASYPTTPLIKSPATTSPAQQPTKNVAAESLDELLLKTRRSSSLGSDASGKRRYLKLGPVHFGEGDGTGDWSEDVLAE